MDFVSNLLNRLGNAPTAELPQLRTDYEAYLETLSPDKQTQVINRVEPILKESMKQSSDRLAAATTAYLTKKEGKVLV